MLDKSRVRRHYMLLLSKLSIFCKLSDHLVIDKSKYDDVNIFKTHQYEDLALPPEYGITRPIKNGSFWDVYFGEFICLFRDVSQAPGIKNKLLYIIMPPGWSHTGEHKTAKQVRDEFIKTGVREEITVNDQSLVSPS